MSTNPCSNRNEGCPLFATKRGCFEDIHHTFHPANSYSQGLAKAYRELPENKQQMCRAEHNLLHATQPIPERPSRETMIAALARQLTKDFEALYGETTVDG